MKAPTMTWSPPGTTLKRRGAGRRINPLQPLLYGRPELYACDVAPEGFYDNF